MPDSSSLGLFVGAAVALLLVPGPAVLYIVGRSMRDGRAAGLISVLGICTGTFCHVVAAAAGLSAALRASPLLFSTIRYAGAVYLIWLGVRALLDRDGAARRRELSGRHGSMQIYAEGVLVNLLNPKTALFFLAFLPQFVDPNRGSVARQVVGLGGLFVLLSLISDSVYAIIAGSFAHYLRDHTRFWQSQRYVTGGIFVALGLLAAFANP